MLNQLSLSMYRFELNGTLNSVALKFMLAPFISYSPLADLACQYGGVSK